ncbi:hypothetical protein N657DRAFT_353021 [Parathielavia appendiculata]|uniref:Uncharacterized protein n=1 Tax=Parathielavia appendiculata TaxID=2587402 RepID=A0AAN6Z4A4_9PEZI|nr:hypothetical protein N657DRAFT_353021 [Parathielavia appendiculata]
MCLRASLTSVALGKGPRKGMRWSGRAHDPRAPTLPFSSPSRSGVFVARVHLHQAPKATPYPRTLCWSKKFGGCQYPFRTVYGSVCVPMQSKGLGSLNISSLTQCLRLQRKETVHDFHVRNTPDIARIGSRIQTTQTQPALTLKLEYTEAPRRLTSLSDRLGIAISRLGILPVCLGLINDCTRCAAKATLAGPLV